MKMSLQGLDYLHGIKKIHRDIKSGNILMTANGDCKLADFGVSAELTNTMSKRKTVIGTPYWMAPEVLQSADYDGKADIWSLAITAIELGAGEPPHASIHPMRAIFIIPNSEPPTMPDPSKWSAAFNDFLKVCLVKNPANRPSAKTLLTTHPFILNAKPKSLIGELVGECMERIDEYRKNDHDEDEGDAEDDGTKGQQTMKQAGPAKNLGTIVSPGVDSGTMVSNPKPSGTMVGPGYASGTMVSGTMVSTPTKTNISSSEYGGYEVAKAKAAGEPIKLSNIVKAETQARAQPAAVVAKPSDQKGEAKAEGKTPVVAQETLSKASAQELRNNLIALNKTYDEEVRQLEAYYTQKRKQLQDFIVQKEKDMKAKGR